MQLGTFILENKDSLAYFKLGLRITFFILIVYWAQLYLEQCRPEVYNIYIAFAKGLILAAIMNAGLWIATFPFGKKHKVLTVFLLLPSLFFNTLVLEIPLFEATFFKIIFSLILHSITFFVLFIRKE